jgi:hypothetical protein
MKFGFLPLPEQVEFLLRKSRPHPLSAPPKILTPANPKKSRLLIILFYSFYAWHSLSVLKFPYNI